MCLNAVRLLFLVIRQLFKWNIRGRNMNLGPVVPFIHYIYIQYVTFQFFPRVPFLVLSLLSFAMQRSGWRCFGGCTPQVRRDCYGRHCRLQSETPENLRDPLQLYQQVPGEWRVNMASSCVWLVSEMCINKKYSWENCYNNAPHSMKILPWPSSFCPFRKVDLPNFSTNPQLPQCFILYRQGIAWKKWPRMMHYASQWR